MLIEVKDLQLGDEIITPLHSQLKYLKVLKNPVQKKVIKLTNSIK